MNVTDQVIFAVIALAQQTNPAPYATITRGALPANNGICMETASSSVTKFMDMGTACVVDVTLNGKHTSAETLSETLHNIHAQLTRRKDYPKTTDYQITDISTISLPAYLDREDGEQWLYGSSLRIKFFYPKMEA